jgi:hypothetical protein
MLAVAAFGACSGWPLRAVIASGLWGAIIAGALLVERWRYKPLVDHRPGREWQATPERFVDPESGQVVTVFFNPATGERRYVGDQNQHRAGNRIRN